MTNRQKFGYLPHVLSLLFPVIGEEGIMKLVEHFGGTRLYVGGDGVIRRLSPVIGNEIAGKVRDVMRENVILSFDVPVLKDFNVIKRRNEIATAYSNGVKAGDIARNLGMTERGVYIAIKSLRDNGVNIQKRGNGTELRREQRVAEAKRLNASGVSIEEIADTLGVTPRTVIGYLSTK